MELSHSNEYDRRTPQCKYSDITRGQIMKKMCERQRKRLRETEKMKETRTQFRK